MLKAAFSEWTKICWIEDIFYLIFHISYLNEISKFLPQVIRIIF